MDNPAVHATCLAYFKAERRSAPRSWGATLRDPAALRRIVTFALGSQAAKPASKAVLAAVERETSAQRLLEQLAGLCAPPWREQALSPTAPAAGSDPGIFALWTLLHPPGHRVVGVPDLQATVAQLVGRLVELEPEASPPRVDVDGLMQVRALLGDERRRPLGVTVRWGEGQVRLVEGGVDSGDTVRWGEGEEEEELCARLRWRFLRLHGVLPAERRATLRRSVPHLLSLSDDEAVDGRTLLFVGRGGLVLRSLHGDQRPVATVARDEEGGKTLQVRPAEGACVRLNGRLWPEGGAARRIRHGDVLGLGESQERMYRLVLPSASALCPSLEAVCTALRPPLSRPKSGRAASPAPAPAPVPVPVPVPAPQIVRAQRLASRLVALSPLPVTCRAVVGCLTNTQVHLALDISGGSGREVLASLEAVAGVVQALCPPPPSLDPPPIVGSLRFWFSRWTRSRSGGEERRAARLLQALAGGHAPSLAAQVSARRLGDAEDREQRLKDEVSALREELAAREAELGACQTQVRASRMQATRAKAAAARAEEKAQASSAQLAEEQRLRLFAEETVRVTELEMEEILAEQEDLQAAQAAAEAAEAATQAAQAAAQAEFGVILVDEDEQMRRFKEKLSRDLDEIAGRYFAQ